eukprot:GHVU01148770.1.p1 GENE.GHVU01148770.1~~GHVU01148770.1.p1  ORF type:complete len:140 (+),score=8.22 GHVU01148770.1:382-801(+)
MPPPSALPHPSCVFLRHPTTLPAAVPFSFAPTAAASWFLGDRRCYLQLSAWVCACVCVCVCACVCTSPAHVGTDKSGHGREQGEQRSEAGQQAGVRERLRIQSRTDEVVTRGTSRRNNGWVDGGMGRWRDGGMDRRMEV